MLVEMCAHLAMAAFCCFWWLFILHRVLVPLLDSIFCIYWYVYCQRVVITLVNFLFTRCAKTKTHTPRISNSKHIGSIRMNTCQYSNQYMSKIKRNPQEGSSTHRRRRRQGSFVAATDRPCAPICTETRVFVVALKLWKYRLNLKLWKYRLNYD